MKAVTMILATATLFAACVAAKEPETPEKPRQLARVKGSEQAETPEAGKKGPTIRDEGWRIPEDKATFHVFVLYGQSNMAGGIKERFGGTLTEEEKTPVPHILQVRFHTKRFRGEGWFPAVHPLHIIPGRPQSFGLGLPFAKEYLKRNPGVTVGLLPCAYGGKRMDLLKEGSGLYNAVVAKCKFAQESGVIKGVLWHQGESDAFNEDRCKVYEGHLHRMIAALRRDVGAPDLPFISGEISIKNYPKDNPVQVANRTLPEKVKHTGWVRTDDLTFCDGKKQVHFDRKSLITMARRYCDEYMRIVEKQKADKGGANE